MDPGTIPRGPHQSNRVPTLDRLTNRHAITQIVLIGGEITILTVLHNHIVSPATIELTSNNRTIHGRKDRVPACATKIGPQVVIRSDTNIPVPERAGDWCFWVNGFEGLDCNRTTTGERQFIEAAVRKGNPGR